MRKESPQNVVVHFVAKPRAEEELENRLRSVGFDAVRRIAGTRAVLISANAPELQQRLNIIIEWKTRRRRMAFEDIETLYPEISPLSKLPKSFAKLVERFYTPPPPNHLSGLAS